jgi:hypothetical protein
MSSEVQTRPSGPRGGRSSGRGGRGGFSSRGGARSSKRDAATNGDSKHEADDAALDDQGEIGELKRAYGSKTAMIKEMFPDWSENDILFALKETDGDENLTVTRMADGTQDPPTTIGRQPSAPALCRNNSRLSLSHFSTLC